MWPKVTQKTRQRDLGSGCLALEGPPYFPSRSRPMGATGGNTHEGLPWCVKQLTCSVSVSTVTVTNGLRGYDALTLVRFGSRRGEKTQFVRVDPDVPMCKDTQGSMWDEKNQVRKLTDKVVSLYKTISVCSLHMYKWVQHNICRNFHCNVCWNFFFLLSSCLYFCGEGDFIFKFIYLEKERE